MLAILLAHAVAALLAPLVVRRLGRNGFFPLAIVPLAGLGWVIDKWGTVESLHITWVPGLSMDIDFRFDALSAIMAVLVLGVGTLILIYCARYFNDDEPRLGIFAAEMVAFAGAMFGLVTSDNMLLLYVFWELTTVLSFLLVGHYAERATSRRAATQALLVTTAGGLAMLVGMIILLAWSAMFSSAIGWLASLHPVIALLLFFRTMAVIRQTVELSKLDH